MFEQSEVAIALQKQAIFDSLTIFAKAREILFQCGFNPLLLLRLTQWAKATLE